MASLEKPMTDAARSSAPAIDRVLIIDPNPPNAKLLGELLRGNRTGYQIHVAADAEQAWKMADKISPQLIFIESKGPGLDGIAFIRELRRKQFSYREALVIMISVEATAAVITGARDAGVHEFMRRPYTMGDLKKRLDAVLGRARAWIETEGYVGPDRRRFNAADYAGARRRRADKATAG